MDKKLIVLGVVSVVLIGGAYGIGTTQAKTNLNDTVLSIKSAEEKNKSLEEKQQSLEKDIEKTEKSLEGLQSDVDSKKDELAEANEIIDKKESLKDEVNSLNGDVDSKKKESDSLKKDIESKNKEIEKLESGIVELKSKPRNLPAGDFVVGSDIDSGRYKVTSNGSSGNFIVNEGSGANVILGKDSYSTEEYVVTLSDGDSIQQSVSVKYQPIEN